MEPAEPRAIRASDGRVWLPCEAVEKGLKSAIFRQLDIENRRRARQSHERNLDSTATLPAVSPPDTRRMSHASRFPDASEKPLGGILPRFASHLPGLFLMAKRPQ